MSELQLVTDQNVIEVRLTGDNVTPGNVRSRDIAELIASVEQMIASVVVRNNPELGFQEDEIIVGLVAVHEGSLRLQFKVPEVYAPAALPAYNLVSNDVQRRDFSSLPLKTVESLRSIRSITVKYSATTEFGYTNGHFAPLASINREVPIEVQERRVSGTTTLYGVVVRIGGEKTPTVQLRLLNGDMLSCEIKGNQRRAIARQLAQRLYTEVGITGTAVWDTRDWIIEDFTIEQITEYSSKGVAAALQGLYETMGTHLEALENIDSFISEIRGENEGDY
jgi:hypothetical protein